MKDNAKEEYEAGNVEASKKKLGVAKSQVESFASMLKITRRISPKDKASFLAESTKIIGEIDELIEYIFSSNMSKDLPLVNNVPIKETKEIDVGYFPTTYQNLSYDQKWTEKKCVKNYEIGAVTRYQR